MTTATATVVHTSSREVAARDAMARVSAAGRITAARLRDEAARARRVEQAYRYADSHGQVFAVDAADVDYCFICKRCTDHFGEHSPEQIAAWRAGRA